VVVGQVGGVPQVDVPGPAECRKAEAQRRDGKAGSPELARRQGHGRVPGIGSGFLRATVTRANRSSSSFMLTGALSQPRAAPSARAALSSTPSRTSVSKPAAARSPAENGQRPSAIGRYGLPGAFGAGLRL